MKHLLTLTLTICIYITTIAQTQLWVSTYYGGVDNRGQIFMGNIDGSDFQPVYNCDTNGSRILGGFAVAPNGLFYGVTSTGGYHDSCVVFNYNPLTRVLTNIHDFVYEPDSGAGAASGLTLASDGLLYGTARAGGVYSDGVIFTVDPTTNNYHPVYHFDSITGAQPQSTLLQLGDGKLYGTATNGGNSNEGTLFKFNPVNNTLTTLYHFMQSTGAHPYFGKLIQAADGKLYGTTYDGGTYNNGVIYSFDLNTNTYTALFSFNDSLGKDCFSGLTEASDGLLYGMTNHGGLNHIGVLFSFNPVDSVYTLLLNLDTTTGAAPTRSLTQISTGKLFGATTAGGAQNTGTIFNYDVYTHTFTKVYDFADGAGHASSEVTEAAINPALSIDQAPVNHQTIIYPNPTSGALNIENIEPGTVLNIHNLLGQTVLTAVAENRTVALNVSQLQPGMYFVNGAKFVKE